jgi:hypothetical protein
LRKHYFYDNFESTENARVSYNTCMAKKKKNAVAQAMVAMRNKKLSAARRKEIAQTAAAARWKDKPAAAKRGRAPKRKG